MSDFYSKLKIALFNASDAALSKANVDDMGGSCNLDRPMVELPAWVRKSEIKERGIPLIKCDYGFFKGAWFIDVPLYGQANRRTTMAKAAADSMKSQGYDAFVWYCMD